MKHRLKIIDIIDEGLDTRTYYLEKPLDFNWEEGSHTHIAVEGYDIGEVPNKKLVRHMSIMTLAQEERIGFTTRFPSAASEYKTKLSEYKVGEELIIFKLGSRMRLRRENRPIVLLSMGVGIATMRPLILAFNQYDSDIKELIQINVDSSISIYKNELESLVNDKFLNIWCKSRVEFYQNLSEVMKKDNPIYYIVGSDTFLRTNIQKLKSNGVKVEDIMIDKKEGILQLYYEF